MGRYRDRWNTEISRRSAIEHQRSLKVKATFAPRGVHGQWIRESATADIKRAARSKSLTQLHLAGQWLEDPPLRGASRPYCMRAMLVANEDVANGCANGSMGRATCWGPEGSEVQKRRRKTVTVSAKTPGVVVRFYKEEAMLAEKTCFLPGRDFIDVEPKYETVMGARGQPAMYQLALQPANALTVHKVQSLTILHQVAGCLEGMFAHGQIYVLISRVTDDEHFVAVGLPPMDLLDDVAAALLALGADVDEVLTKAAGVVGSTSLAE